MSVISAPPRKPVFLVWGAYVAISGARLHTRGRVWLLADSPELDARLSALIAWNDATTGRVEYEDLGEIVHANIHTKRTSEIQLVSGEVLWTVEHPCVCGAGGVGNASPDPGRITLTYVNPYNRERVTIQ